MLGRPVRQVVFASERHLLVEGRMDASPVEGRGPFQGTCLAGTSLRVADMGSFETAART